MNTSWQICTHAVYSIEIRKSYVLIIISTEIANNTYMSINRQLTLYLGANTPILENSLKIALLIISLKSNKYFKICSVRNIVILKIHLQICSFIRLNALSLTRYKIPKISKIEIFDN